jgi:hypothetical protein
VLAELAADILLDFTGEDGQPLAPLAYIRRAAERALPVVAADLAVAYRLDGEVVLPDMPGEHREAWLIRTKILVCHLLRAQAAQRVDFSSGDKRMSRSSEAKHFADLEKDLLAQYTALIKRLNPLADETLLELEAQPLIYHIGSRRPERC